MTDIVERVTDELLAHGEFSANPNNNRPNAREAAKVVVEMVTRAASEWRHISTAPRDGQLAIVYRPLAHKSGDQPVAVKRLIEGNHHCWNSTVPPGETPNNPTADGSCHVTHWMPLPAPPQRNEVKP